MAKKTEGHFGKIYDVVTVGERGQIVIPVSARRELGISPGDKFAIMKPPVGGAFLSVRLSELGRLVGRLTEGFGKIKKTIKEKI